MEDDLKTHLVHLSIVCSPIQPFLWKSIQSGWPNFSRYVLFEIGDGSRVKFWHGVWCGDSPLKLSFPKLFNISRDKEAYVVDLMKFPNGVLYWDMEFLRAIQDWELESLSTFMDVIYSVSLTGTSEDKLCWIQPFINQFSDVY
ncbi:hypothetical protein ACB092_12G190100 [Castanea dentata]